jgi:hypothetical protein
MKIAKKLTSRKLWVTCAGVAAGAATDHPVLSVIIAAVYVLVEGLIDAVKDTGEGRAAE